MKVNEVVKEGILDPITNWQQRRAGQKDVQALSNNVIEKWNTFLGQSGISPKRVTPELLHSWTKKFFRSNNVPTPEQGETQNNYLRRTTQEYKSGLLGLAPTTTKTQPVKSKKDMQVVVDAPRELTVSYNGQLYTTKGGKEPWVNTKTGKQVNPSFGKVLDIEWDKLAQPRPGVAD